MAQSKPNVGLSATEIWVRYHEWRMERAETNPTTNPHEIQRAREISWIRENLESFWSFASEEYRESGRGALVVDTNQVVEQAGQATHPMIYMPQEDLQPKDWANKTEIVRIVGEYDPSWEFLTVLIKPEEESVYRMGVYWENEGDSEIPLNG